MPANTMFPKLVSVVSHLAGILGTLGVLSKILTTVIVTKIKRQNTDEETKK